MSPNVHVPTRLRSSTLQATVNTDIAGLPELPVIDWAAVGLSPPTPTEPTPALPSADVLLITWTGAEWAALHHVFCAGTTPMGYGQRHPGNLPGWQRYTDHLPVGGPADWTFWGLYRTVTFGGRTIVLFKSNTHLDWPGRKYLQMMVQALIDATTPALVVSVGTAGGARIGDHVGTVYAVDAATFYRPGRPENQWSTFRSGWAAATSVLNDPAFTGLLLPIPTRSADLETLRQQFNSTHHTDLAMTDLDPDGLNSGAPTPHVGNQTPGGAALLTTSTFVVGTTAGTFADFTCIEMDDAIVAQTCASADVLFGSVRNLSDPIQNADLPAAFQSAWGSLIYTTYGLYTSYDGALVAAAALAGTASPAADSAVGHGEE